LLIEFGGKALEYDYVCHIHGKRSGLITYGSAWRHQLFYGLLGNEDIVRSIFTMFAQEEKVGVIFPFPYRDVLPEYQWGSNKEATVELLMKLGVDISVIDDQPLEFPAGSMFWFRPEALRNLLCSRLSWEDFPPEPIGRDGTLAHAVERSVCYVARHNGYESVPTLALAPEKMTV
jgi:lipopolysaccharide biosynthesis protein